MNPQQRFELDFTKREFDERNIYVIMDGQDLFAGCTDPSNPMQAGEQVLKFTCVEINSQLCRMIPQKTWESKAA